MTAATNERAHLLPATLLVGDEFLATASGGEMAHINPATGRQQKIFPVAAQTEIEAAVTAAKDALPAWRRMHPAERRRILTRVADLMRSKAEEFGTIASLETGIPYSTEMAYRGADWFDNAASWADKLSGEVVPSGPGVFDYVLIEPVGIVAVILTWNGSAVGVGMCVAPALAAGCCVLVKPSELAPFSSMFLGQLCLEAGLPPGVLAVLPGGRETGEAIVSHPDVAKISFTGGTATARAISATCALQLKPLLLELGGKSANIVFPDADLDEAAQKTMRAIYLSGQGCTAPTRLLVHEDVYSEMVDRVTEMWSAVRVGDPFDSRSTMGPVITEAACDRILGITRRAQADGAKLVIGGTRLGGELEAGFFLSPTVFCDVDTGSELAQQEVFGPVIAITPFSTESQAIEMANATDYGLAAYVHSESLSRCLRMAAELEAGNVGINGGSAPAGPEAPFGGIRQSGYGRVGGKAGVLEFCRVKNVMVRSRAEAR